MNPDEEIVITGVAGRFPNCENFQEFQDALFQGIDLISEDDSRFPPGLWGTPRRSGKIKNIDKYDAGYFGIHAKQVDIMDPRHRILNETVYEAIVDAGYNPQELRGSKTGVYVGIASFNSMDKVRERKTDGYSNTGLSLAMAANRTSYCFDLKGPSYSVDSACSSSLYAFVSAINDIKMGNAESALVCGAAINLEPHESLEFSKLNVLSHDGKCKVFSKKRDGYVRSESVVTMFLQKRKKSRRIYVTVLGAKTNADGFKNEGITFPSTNDQLRLMQDVLKQTNLNPLDISYVEAHGTGTEIGDMKECEAIARMFCQKRKEPLLIGAVKSNMGHSEMASGLCSLAKILIAMETGVIPANLHVDELDNTLTGLIDHKLKVVTESEKWDGKVAALNSFGFGGANAHAILRSHSQNKYIDCYPTHTHRLVQVSGRTEEAVYHFLDGVDRNKDDPEFLALVDELHKMNFKGHTYRGYTILGEKPERNVEKFVSNRPIWFIYTGMGCQWHGMGKDLMKLDVFKNTIMRCAKALKPYDVDLVELIMNSTPTTYNDISNCFYAVSAVEIALTDVLASLGIVPDGIAGHSLGEVGCAYADGITAEQAILLAYARAHASRISSCPSGQMVTVGLGKEECQKLLPDDIYIACQNSSDNVTISGPTKSTKVLVEKLTAQNIFTRLVPTGGYAYHSKYIEEAGFIFLDFIKKVIDNPKLRSPKWISSSVPPHKTHLQWAKLNGPEYHYNNFVSRVLFDQIYEHIPCDAIVIEVSPHGLLQPFLKKETSPNITHIVLSNMFVKDNERFLLSAIGKIFIAGGQPNLRGLYPEVKFPVSRGTTKISPLVKWDHRCTWFVPYWENKEHFGEAVEVDVSEEKYSYLYGHNVGGRILMPASGYLELVWNVFARKKLTEMEKLSIVFENVKLLRATVLPPLGPITFFVNIMRHSGNFEVFEGGSIVITGQIYSPRDASKEFITQGIPFLEKEQYLLMKKEDVYKECRLRTYNYQGLFQNIIECNVHGTYGRLLWQNNFTSFLDTMMQLTIIMEQSRDLRLPTFIQQVTIDPVEHLKIAKENYALEVTNNKYTNVIRAGGVEIIGLEASEAISRVNIHNDPILERYDFISYESFKHNQYDEETSLSIALQIVLQNLPGLIKSPRLCELISSEHGTSLTSKIKEILDKQPMVQADLICVEASTLENVFDVITFTEEVIPNVNMSLIKKSLTHEGFILYKGNFSVLPMTGLGIIFQRVMNNTGVYLLRCNDKFPEKYAVVQVSVNDFGWLEEVKTYMEITEHMTIYLLSTEEINGLVGFLKSVVTEPHTIKFRVIVLDARSKKFNIDSPLYRDQLRNYLTINILRNGQWGTYIFLPIKDNENREVENAGITVDIPGDLSTIAWIEQPKHPLGCLSNSEVVQVFYMSLNFKDVMIATSKLAAPNMQIGFEYSGVTDSGRKVMGLIPSGTLSLQVRTDPIFTWKVPNSWTLEEAATVPCVYSTCYYAMVIRGKIQKGESILIHSGTGGIGLAAINIALSMDCTVFTTVSTSEKRDYLKKMFPKLNIINIGISRNKSFETMVMDNTKGEGVNLVLNSLAADLFQASLRCIGMRGRYLEIGKRDLLSSSPINGKMFLKNCSFHGVLLDEIMSSENSVNKEIHNLLAEGIEKGVVKPLPTTVFNEFEAENAFRFMSTGKHKGKVLIQLRKEEPQVLKFPARRMSAVPKIYFDPRKSYVLIGGLGGFGLELTNWIINRGATKVVLNSRRTISNGYQSYCLNKWTKNKKISIKINTDDSTSQRGADALIKYAQALGPIGGIFNMALVLRDGLLNNQTKTTYEEVFKPKIVSAHNMDTATRKYCPQIDHFVVFSSVSCGRGNAGLTNYSMANSAMEMLCEKRKLERLPGLAIQWGPIGDVGFLNSISLGNKVFDYLSSQSINSCLHTLEKFMLQDAVIGSSVVLTKKINKLPGKVTSPAETVAHILGIKSLDLIDKSATLSDVGLDSLMTAEIKQTLYRNYQLDYSEDALKELSLNDLIAEGNSQLTDNISTPDKIVNNTYFSDSVEVLVSKKAVVTLNAMETQKTPIFLLHPIEGTVDLLRPLALNLKTTVYGFQCTKDVNYNSMQDYARYFINLVKKIQPDGPYCFCGYSFGACVALEMSLQLEKQNENVNLIAIDGAPEYVQFAIKSAFVKVDKSISKFRAAVLERFAVYFKQADIVNIKDELFDCEQWEEQLKITSSIISKQTSIPKEDVAISAQLFFNRCNSGYYYRPSGTLHGKVLLIRREDNPYHLLDDYSLQKVCQQKVEIVKIHGDHQTILKGNNLIEVARVICESRLY